MKVIPEMLHYEGDSRSVTWWRWFQKRYMMKVIPETLHDEGDSRNVTWWRWFQKRYLMKVISETLPDKGDSRNVTWWRWFQKRYLMKVILETLPDEGDSRNVTWWWWFQKCVVCTNFDIYVCIDVQRWLVYCHTRISFGNKSVSTLLQYQITILKKENIDQNYYLAKYRRKYTWWNTTGSFRA